MKQQLRWTLSPPSCSRIVTLILRELADVAPYPDIAHTRVAHAGFFLAGVKGALRNRAAGPSETGAE